MKLITAIIIIGSLAISFLLGGLFLDFTETNGSSMCPTLQKKAKAFNIEVDLDDELEIGKIYTFKRGEKNIKHRLINTTIFNYGNNLTEIIYIFKGDNVDYLDEVKRKDIIRKHIFEIPLKFCD